MNDHDTQSYRRPENIETIAALTPMQQGILFHALGAKELDPYLQQLVFALRGNVDPRRLERAWQAATDRHQVLRADYRWEEAATPLQVIFKSRAVSLAREDWRELEPAQQLRRLNALLREERREGYDFRRASSARLRLIQTSAEAHWLVWSHHHITLDGWSSALVLGDVLRSYHRPGEASTIAADPTFPFTDYVAWLAKRDPAGARAYWQERLSGLDAKTPLPTSAAVRQQAASYAERVFALAAATTDSLQGRCRALGVTLNTLVQGAWALLLGRYAGVGEVVFGATVSGRPEELHGVEASVGLFINTLPIRVRLEPARCVRQWLRDLQEQNMQSRDHGHVGLADIRRAAGRPGDEALFDSVVVFENFPVSEVLRRQPDGLQIEFVPLQRLGEATEGRATGRNNYPLTLNVVPGAELTLTLAYRGEAFEASAIDALGERLVAMLHALCEQPERALGTIGLEAGARPAISIAPALATTRLVLDQFAARVQENPTALAVRDADTTLDYRALDAISDRVARALISRGIESDDRVGLCAERGLEFVIFLLGILKAGAAYVPLDPALPVDRLEELHRESGARCIVAGTNLESIASQLGAEILTPASLTDESRGAVCTTPLGVAIHAEQLAYVIFTSGSTGRPKGVAVSHGALGKYVSGLSDRLAGGRAAPAPSATSMAMVSTIAADLGHTVLFGALCGGACLHLIGAECAFDPDRFAEYMARHRVDILKIVPSHFRALLHAREPQRVVPRQALILGGEASDWGLVEHVQRLDPGCRVFNHYGPTETTVGVSMYECARRSDGDTVPMGQALPGASLYVLDPDGNPLPMDVPGELYVGGQRLARGYWGRPSSTAERFVPSPFAAGERVYKTGDRVRVRHDGQLEFLGRMDRQVKLRGYRVELGEIEARLLDGEGVARAVVILRASKEGEHRLVGFAVPRPECELSESALVAHLQRRLPDYMVPSRVLVLSALPLTANGKLDVAALPDDLPSEARERVAPATPVEQSLMQVWSEVLGIEHLGVDDDFFALGGDSILSLQLVARARRRGLRMSPQQIFESRTIRRLASTIAEPSRDDGPTPGRSSAPSDGGTGQSGAGSSGVRSDGSRGEVPLLPAQLAFLEQEFPERHRYTQSLMLTVKGTLDAGRLERAIESLQRRHDALRLVYSQDLRGTWRQRYLEPDPEERRRTPVLSVRSARTDQEVEALMEGARERLDLRRGPLFQAVLIDLDTRGQRLFLVAHHLIVDVVSWRILLEGLESSYRAPDVSLEPAAEACSVARWSEALRQYAGGERLKAQLPYWTTVLGAAAAGDLPRDNTGGRNWVKYRASADFTLSVPDTQRLLRQLPEALGAEINELLLTALARALSRWSEHSSVLLQLEGHGRDGVLPALDASETVGWLTSVHPVRLTPGMGSDVRASLAAIRDQLRTLPDRGIGYGVLRYVSDKSVRDALEGLGTPRVTFNYLGQFDSAVSGSELFEAVQASGAAELADETPLGNWLTFNGHVSGRELKMTCNYSRDLFHPENIERLVQQYRSELQALIALVSPASREPRLSPAAGEDHGTV
jgi:amino acid adenylation domain-containing protein/non-ribosomal peptide synthase protein (TIGR01720 family)